WKPAARARTQLLLAGLMWSCVGGALLVFGLLWTARSPLHPKIALTAGALVLGLAKSRFVLDRTARRMTARIVERGDGRCVGGFLSPFSWLMVVVMAAGGRLLRHILKGSGWAGLLYALVGCGLLFSSRILWARWKQQEPANARNVLGS
ncbi:MAG: hypothetical protein D6806_11245, partial [Deltaproteobacteria bacterium]